MVDNFPHRRRIQLVLGKFAVKRIIKVMGDYEMYIELPGLGVMSCPVPTTADVREGDLLTFYTEILSNAKSR